MPCITINGNPIAYDLSGKGDPCVLIQGTLVDRTIWSRQIPVFSSQFQVLTYDLSGLGESGPSIQKFRTVETLAEELASLLDQLGFGRIRLCGLSLGGMIAQAFAARWPGRLESLVLCDTTASATLNLSRISCPVLLVNGQFGLKSVLAHRPYFRSKMPQLSETLIPGAGQHSCLENPAVFNSQVLGFLLKDRLLLEPANPAYRASFQEMAAEFLANNEINADHQRALNHFDLFMLNLRAYKRGENLPPGFVPMTSYWLVDADGNVLGESRLRHVLNPDLEIEGGHIGYRIRPSARRQGLGSLVLALTLGKASDLGLHRALVTCDTDNIASARIIEKNGGRLENMLISPESGKQISRYWIELFPGI